MPSSRSSSSRSPPCRCPSCSASCVHGSHARRCRSSSWRWRQESRSAARSPARSAIPSSTSCTGSTGAGPRRRRLGRPSGPERPEPTPDERRAVKLVERDGRTRGRDRLRPRARRRARASRGGHGRSGLALQNDRLQAELRAEVGFISTVTNTAPSLLVNIGTDGRDPQHQRRRARGGRHRRRGGSREVEHYWELFIDPRRARRR